MFVVHALMNESGSPRRHNTSQMDHLPLYPCRSRKAGDPPLSCVPKSSGCYDTPLREAGPGPGWMLPIWEVAPCVIDDMGSSAAGGHCTLSTHTCTPKGTTREGCRSTNKHKSIANPTPFHQHLCPGLSFCPCMCAYNQSERSYCKNVVETLWEGC